MHAWATDERDRNGIKKYFFGRRASIVVGNEVVPTPLYSHSQWKLLA